MRSWIRAYHIDVKYALIGTVVIGTLIALDRAHVLGNLDHAVTDMLDATGGIGAVGMFLIALVSNCALFVQIPYTLPLLSAAISGATMLDMLILGFAAGVGAGFGEVIKYHVAHRVLAKKPNLRRSQLYRWVERQATEKPRHVKWIVFVWAASVIPDDTVIIPLAMIRYGVRRIAVPLFTGKVIHNLLFASLFFALSDTAEDILKGGVRVDLAFGMTVSFLLVVLYQAEKALHHGQTAPEPVTADAPE